MLRSTTKEMDYAVLTGDIVKSTRLPREIQAAEVIDHAWSEIPAILDDYNSSTSPCKTSKIDIFRGDGFQAVVSPASAGIVVAVLMRTALLSAVSARGRGIVDARIYTAVGRGSDFNEDEPSRNSGRPFVASGRGLELMKGRTRLGLHGASGSQKVIIELVDALVSRWSQRQAIASLGAFARKAQGDIGDSWPDKPLDRRTVGWHLTSARTAEVIRACDYLYETFDARKATELGER